MRQQKFLVGHWCKGGEKKYEWELAVPYVLIERVLPTGQWRVAPLLTSNEGGFFKFWNDHDTIATRVVRQDDDHIAIMPLDDPQKPEIYTRCDPPAAAKP